MKSLSIIILLFLGVQINSFCQETTILAKELEEITINAKPKKKINFTTFDLMGKKFFSNQSLMVPIDVDSNNSIGVFVPVQAKKNLTIKNIIIPVFRFNKSDTSLKLTYFLGLKYTSGSDTVFQVIPDQIQNDSSQLQLAFNASVPLNSSINGFYFFIKYTKRDAEKHSDFNIYFNNKYKSRFTRKLNQLNAIEAYDISNWLKNHMLTVKEADHVKYLNWRVKITYNTN